jgi:hypothetical protein
VTGVNPDENPTEITIFPAFEEASLPNEEAYGLHAAYRMYAISGSNKLTNGGDASSLRGVLGSVSVDSAGNVQAGVGVRGGVTMGDADAWMGVGACLATYTKLDNGTLDNWYGLGIESPIVLHRTVEEVDYFATVKKEIAGISIGSLLRLVDEDVVFGESCTVYGLKIMPIDPDGHFVGDVGKYGIYQAGDEQNYLGGPLEVNEYIDINNTSSVRAYLDVDNDPSSSVWKLVAFDAVTYDDRSEFNTTTSQFTASLSGKYQINVCLLFLNTECASKIQIRIMRNPGTSPIADTLVTGYGYCNPSYPENEDSASICFSNCIKLNAGDQLEVKYFAPDDITIAAGEHQSYITIQKVS